MKYPRLVGLLLLCPFALLLIGTGRDGVRTPPSEGRAALAQGDTAISDEEMLELYKDKVPTKVWLKTYCNKMAPVEFNHAGHVAEKRKKCVGCHHLEPRDIKPCEKCHGLEPENKDAPKYEKAFHEQCRDCHKKAKDADKSPPVKCLECHRKENTEKSGVACPKPKE